MRSMIVHGFVAVSFGAVLAIGIGTHAQAAAPANYSQACKELVASGSRIRQLQWRRRLMSIVRRAAPLAGQSAAITTESRRWWPPSVASHKRTPSV